MYVRDTIQRSPPPPLCVADYNDNAFVIINVFFVLFSKSQQVYGLQGILNGSAVRSVARYV